MLSSGLARVGILGRVEIVLDEGKIALPQVRTELSEAVQSYDVLSSSIQSVRTDTISR